MSDTISILRRKMRQSEADEAPPERALSRAAVRAADGAGGLSVTVAEIDTQEVYPDRLADHLGEGALILGIEGATSLCAALVMDPGLRDAVIEQATRGELRVGASPVRAPTQTDAELVRPLADLLLAERSGPDLRSGDMIESARALILMLPDVPLRLTWLRLAIGEGGRSGALGLVDPVLAEPGPAPAPEAGAEPEAVRAALMAVPARLEAVLHRQDLPLSDLRALRAGHVVPLAGARLDSVRLEAPAGGPALSGRLGQVAGRRALRIAAGPPPDLAGLPIGRAPEGSDDGG